MLTAIRPLFYDDYSDNNGLIHFLISHNYHCVPFTSQSILAIRRELQELTVNRVRKLT
jgi:hypothetical protein